MKIRCGLRKAEKMALKKRWHKWFAWHPVLVGRHDCRWLEVVMRRGYSGPLGWEYSYASLERWKEVQDE